MPDDNVIPVPEVLNTSATNVENLTITTCSFDNCTEEDFHICRKCSRRFCVMHSNRFSPNFCQECFRNLVAIETKFSRVFEDYDTKTDKLHIRKETHTKYYMDGMDWPFLGLWIKNLTDDELRAWWVFHHCVMSLIEVENETRRIEKYRKTRAKSVGLITGINKKAGIITKTTKHIDTAEDVRKKLRKQGVPDSIIDMMVVKMGVK